MPASQPWWDEYPEVLQREESALEHLGGQPPALNQKLLDRAKVRQYGLPYTDADGQTYELTVTYADLHPYFRVEVTSNDLFGVHQQPFSRVLCLLREGEDGWQVGETAAEMIAEQMPSLLADVDHATDAAQATPDRDAETSEGDTTPVLPHVEPYVGYYSYEGGTAIRVDGSWAELTEATEGSLVIGLEQDVRVAPLRGALLQVLSADGAVLREADESTADLFGKAEKVTGRWVRLPVRPPEDGGEGVLDAATAQRADLAQPSYEKFANGSVDVSAVVFTDDISADITTGAIKRGDAWQFVVRAKGSPPPSPKKGKGGKRKGGGRTTPTAEKVGPYLARAYRAGRNDLTERVPTLRPLADKTVAVFGTGGIGAPSAVEFAKASIGELHLVDRDLLDPGNGVRWPVGYAFAGHPKVGALGHHLRQNWPHTKVHLHGSNIGGSRVDGNGEPQWETFSRIAASANCIYDATATPGINYFLSELAYDHDIPYVVVAATEGGWGGYVARFHPEPDGPCWTCLMHYFATSPDLLPPADPDPATRTTWPAGCTDPTFTGTGFDVASIALAGVRLTAATLCEGIGGTYPRADWHYARYEFRSADQTLPGSATHKTLEQHPDCNRCRKRTSNT